MHLRDRLALDSGFLKEMEELDYKHQIALQRALYTNTSSIRKSMIVDAKDSLSKFWTFLFFGSQMPELSKKSTEMIYLYMIRWLQEHITDKCNEFVIVYFHTECNSYNNYSVFRKVLRSLPMNQLERLRSLVIMSPSLTVRAMEWFVSGVVNKHLNGITRIANSFTDLKKYGISVRLDDFELFPKVVWQDLNSSLKLASKTKPQFKNQPSKYNNNKSTPQLYPVAPRKMHLEDYQSNQQGIPLVVQLMVAYFVMNKDRLKYEGLFRKSVSIDDIYEAVGQLQKCNYEYLQQITNPHLVSNLIKKFFSDLQQPIMSYQVYNKLTHDGGRANQISYLEGVMSLLPLKNYVSIVFLLNFFIQEVIPLGQFNKMTYYNAAVVLAPCLMRSSKNAIEDLIFSKKIVLILEFILENFDQIFGDVQKREGSFRESAKAERNMFYTQTVKGPVDTHPQILNFLMQPPRLQDLNRDDYRLSHEPNTTLLGKRTPGQ